MNKTQAEGLESRPYTAMISIYTPGDSPPVLSPFWPMRLQMSFHDFSPSRHVDYVDKLLPMSMEQAVWIVDFVNTYSNYDFVAHCDAGISRSMAVGEYIRRHYQHKLVMRAANTRDFLNLHVAKLLERAHEARFASID